MSAPFYRVSITVAIEPGVGVCVCEEDFPLQFSARECFGRWALGLKAGTLTLEHLVPNTTGTTSELIQEIHGTHSAFQFPYDTTNNESVNE